MKWLHQILHHVGRYVSKPWYPMLVGFLAFLDTFVFVIPTDGLLVSSVISAPRHVFALAFWTTTGSVFGSVLFAVLLEHGVKFADLQCPAWINAFFDHWGTWALFGISALPIMHHPVLILACLAHTPLLQITLAMLGGRILKYGVYAWVSSHAPKLLSRFKLLEREVVEAEKELELPPTPHDSKSKREQ